MIKDRMTLALSIDTQYLKTTVDAMSESDETLAAYAVGFIPWDLVQESTLFNWIRYNVKYTYNVAASINPVDNPYTDGTQLSATKGIPFMYAVSPTASPTQDRALYKSPLTGEFASAGDSYKSGTAYNTTNTDIKNILHSIDLSDIVANVRNATPYMYAQFASVAILYDNETYDFDNAFTYTTEPINYNPVTDSIDSFTCRYVINGAIFTRTITDADFKTWGKMGYSGTIETGGHKYAIFDYCVGIYCVNSLQINGYPGAHVNGFIADNFPFRYTSTIGLHDSYNYPSSGGFAGFPQGWNAKNCACGFNTPYSSSPIDWSVFVNNDTAPSIDVVLNNNDRSEITDTYYRYKTSMAFSVLMKSYTAIDLKIMALISTPIVKVNNVYYCPEFDENYALTGNWVEYTNQNLNPDINEFDPADIPAPPTPGEEGENVGDSVTLPSVFGVGTTNGFVTQYALRKSDIQQLGALLWTSFVDADYWQNYLFSLALDTGTFSLAGLMSFFVSLKVYPFPLVNVSGLVAEGGNDMYVGTGIVPLHFTNKLHSLTSYVDKIEGGYIDVMTSNFFKDWRDYVNTEIILYVPYCGTIHLNPADVVGNRVRIRYVIDFSTGGCVAYVMCDAAGEKSFMIGALPGQIGADVPLSATAAGEIAARFIGDAMNAGHLVGGEVGNLASGIAGATFGKNDNDHPIMGGGSGSPFAGVAGVYGGLPGAMGADLAPGVASQALAMLTRSAVSAPLMSGGRGFASFGAPQIPYIQIRRGIYPEISKLSEISGKPSAGTYKVGDLSGFVSGVVKTDGINAHENEKAKIRRLIAGGIYV